MNWYFEVFRKYAVFNGRARRREYWYFILFNILVAFVLGLVDGMLLLGAGTSGLGILGSIYTLAVILPSTAAAVRRLHDTDRSGWWILITLIPLIGAIVFLVFMVTEGTTGDNRYGADPKA